MTENNKAVTLSEVEEFDRDFHAEKAYGVASRAAVQNGLMEAAADYMALRGLTHHYSIDLKQGAVTNQKQSGRCWIFSALNTFRYEIIKKYNLKDFELSQTYMFFYDKLEKANYYLESMLTIRDEPVDGRLFCFLNQNPLQDGGQWDMLAKLVRKYGVVPKDVYPDAKSAENSRFMDAYLTSRLREDAIVLRNAAVKEKKSRAELTRLKKQMLSEVYRILCISLGEPPKRFDLILRDKDDKLIAEYDLSPTDFFRKYVGIDLDETVSLVNAPAENKPMNRTYTVKFLGNVIEDEEEMIRPGRADRRGGVIYLNLEMKAVKDAVIKQLKDGHPVWFGSDSTKFSLRNQGIFDRTSANVEALFDIHYQFTKGERLIYGDSAMTHAMVILGVNLKEDGTPEKWHVENSWGKDVGKEGHFTASDAWFDEFVYQVVVYKKYLPKKILKLFEQEPIELEPWDPLGALA